MKPVILSYVLGPLENNTYVIADPDSGEAAVIDPSFAPDRILEDAQNRKLRIGLVLLTHAHFDHIAGAAQVANEFSPPVSIALHPNDLALYAQGGGAAQFGIPYEPGPNPQVLLAEGQILTIGSVKLEVHHTPGHTPGHVVFTCPQAGVIFCGDLIFAGSVGRTDLPGGSHELLMDSIKEHILTLPAETRLLSGHGPETTVAIEQATNPFLS
jgi:hydroxyacylglutathione hydrolase